MSSRIVGSRPPEPAWTEQEGALLSAAREERMPVALEARVRAALELGCSTPVEPASGSSSRSLTDTGSARPLLAGKLSLWGTMGVITAVAVGYYALHRAPRGADDRPTASTPSAATIAAPRAPTPERPRRAPAVSSDTGDQATGPDQLRIEAELLEHVRRALGQGALRDAGRWLARYDAHLAQGAVGALRPEREVLAIELQVRTGARDAAKTQADRFLREHPDHPLRDRVRALANLRR